MAGEYFTNIPLPLAPAEEKMLIARYKEQGDLTARSKLIRHNQRLVIDRLSKRGITDPHERKDAFLWGMFGLMKAVERFNLKKFKEVRFSTYATDWIDKYILGEYYTDKGVAGFRLPRNAILAVHRLERLGIGATELTREAMELVTKGPVTTSTLFGIRSILLGGNSFDRELTDEDSAYQLSPYDAVPDPGQDMTNIVERILVADAFEQLSAREREIIFRVDVRGEQHSLVASSINMKVNELRRVRKSALIKLRGLLADLDTT